MHSPALLPSIRVISNVLAELPNCILLRNVKDNKILFFLFKFHQSNVLNFVNFRVQHNHIIPQSEN